MTSDLISLKARVLQAHTRGYQVAWAEEYVAELGGMAPPDGVLPNSAEHLLHLIQVAESGAKVAPPEVSSVEAEPIEAEPVGAEEADVEAPVVEAPVVVPVGGKKSKKSKR